MAVKIIGGRIEGLLGGLAVAGARTPDVEVQDTHISGLIGVHVSETGEIKIPFDVPGDLMFDFLVRNDLLKAHGQKDVVKAAEQSGLKKWLSEHGVELASFLLAVGMALPK